jgi:hypothetical protein
MKKRKDTYFTIQRFHLQDKRIFPFHLYVFNPMTEVYNLFLSANYPMDQSKSDLLDFIESKGGKIAINMRQRKTFLRNFNYYDLDIPSLVPADLKEIEKERLKQVQHVEEQEKKSPFKLDEHIHQCIEDDNFLPMILAAKNKILTLSVKISHTVSLSRYFSMIFMHEDNHLNRVVALSFFCAQSLGIVDEEEIGDLICSAFLAHIGQTQYSPQLTKKAQLKLNNTEKRLFQKHPGLSLHLIRKSQVNLSHRCLNIIIQHHERTEGQGFPEQKKSPHIDKLALILGACAHIFEYSSGQVSGSPIKIPQMLKNLKDHNLTPGLEYGFGDKITESLIKQIENHSADKAA